MCNWKKIKKVEIDSKNMNKPVLSVVCKIIKKIKNNKNIFLKLIFIIKKGKEKIIILDI